MHHYQLGQAPVHTLPSANRSLLGLVDPRVLRFGEQAFFGIPKVTVADNEVNFDGTLASRL